MTSFHRTVLALALLAAAMPASAHHRQTPPVVPLTSSGDTPLPRQAPAGRKTLALAVQWGDGKRIVAVSPWRGGDPAAQTIIAASGNNANPAVSGNGRAFAFDSDTDPFDLGGPGRQVRQVYGVLGRQELAVSNDPTGASANPTIDGAGRRIAFESTADLANTGPSGVRQVFVLDPDGTVRQMSRGRGVSRNPLLSPKRDLLIFESTSDPSTGVDRGVSQIWVGNADDGDVEPITVGTGSSTNASISNDGRIVGFESTTDLRETQLDTGTAQIFVYDTRTKTYAQITDDAGGCHLPGVYNVLQDYRVAYVCNGVPYLTMLRGNQRYEIPTPAGVTQRVIPALGLHFLLLSTTADLYGNGAPTPGNRVYLVNLYKRPALPIAGDVKWFPSQGLPPL